MAMGANGSSSYDKLKKLSRETGANRDDLIALTSDNDPFYIGTDLQHEMGEWFKGEWRERGFLGRGGVHLRRAHYQMLGTTKHNGEIYENDTASWKYLLKVSKFARILGYVNPEDIIDRRNPEPHVYFYRPEEAQEKGFEAHIAELNLPTPDTDLLS